MNTSLVFFVWGMLQRAEIRNPEVEYDERVIFGILTIALLLDMYVGVMFWRMCGPSVLQFICGG